MVSCGSRSTIATAQSLVNPKREFSPVPPSGALGVFGGTFDPPHAGHVAAARAALSELGLARLLVTVAGDPWQKSSCRAVTAGAHRLAMAKLAFSDVDEVEVSDAELRRAGPTYTVDTVRELIDCSTASGSPAASQPDGPERAIYLVIGSHAASGVHTWHRAAELAEMVTLAVVQPAPTAPQVPAGWRAVAVPMPPVDVSSSRLRAELAAGRRAEVRDLVPDETLAYVDAHGLYIHHARRPS